MGDKIRSTKVIIIVIIIIIIIIDVSVTGLFSPVLLLNQQWSPPLTLQASHCSTFRIMCDVPSTAVFCSESIECFPGTASNFSLSFSLLFQWLQLLLVQSYISGSTFVASEMYDYTSNYYYYYNTKKIKNIQYLYLLNKYIKCNV